MERTGLERTDRKGLAGTEWRMQVGGERLGRAGIEVAGQDRCGVGGVARRGMAWYGNAGMEKPVKARGMEGSGTVGIMEAWQDRRGMARSVAVGFDTETQARTGLGGQEGG